MPANVENLLYFIDGYHYSAAENQFHFEKFEDDHNYASDGVNWYLWLTASERERMKAEYGSQAVSQGLRNWHVRFLLDFEEWLRNSSRDEKWIIFCMEPRETASKASIFNPNNLTDFAFVKGNRAWLTSMAKRLKGFQDKAREFDKTLKIVIRFAAEMNDIGAEGNNWAGKPSDFKDCFKFVREIFDGVAGGDFQFCFSPALRADINTSQKYPRIRACYPGDDVVDIVSASWYIQSEPGATKEKGLSIVKRYFDEFAGSNSKKIGIDEMGVFDGPETDKDPLIQEMFGRLAALNYLRPFSYATLFLGPTTSLNARLQFLRDPNFHS